MMASMIVNRLSALMGERRISVAQLSHRAELSYATVKRMYDGTAERLDMDTLNSLCRALRVEPGDILKYVPEEAEGRSSSG